MIRRKADEYHLAKVEERLQSVLDAIKQARAAQTDAETNNYIDTADEFLDSAMNAMAEVEGN